MSKKAQAKAQPKKTTKRKSTKAKKVESSILVETVIGLTVGAVAGAALIMSTGYVIAGVSLCIGVAAAIVAMLRLNDA